MQRWLNLAGGPRLTFQRWTRPAFRNFYASFWHGLWVPRVHPRMSLQMNSEVRSALADPAVRQQMADQGQEIPPLEQQSPQALGAHQQAEIKKWWPIIKAAGIKAY